MTVGLLAIMFSILTINGGVLPNQTLSKIGSCYKFGSKQRMTLRLHGYSITNNLLLKFKK